MPYHDPKINSTWQVFVSTFLIEHAFKTLTDEAPVEILLAWDFLNNTDLMITTDAVEALFPFATQHFGNMIPVDINLKIAKAWDWESVYNNNNGSLTFKVDLIADALMHLPTGGRHLIGTAEFYNGSLSIHLNITKNKLMGDITYVDFESCYVQTTYGIERYEATPYVINIIVFGALTALRVNFFENGIEIPKNFSLLYVNNTYLGYYDDYIALGLTPHFKKVPPPPPQPKN